MTSVALYLPSEVVAEAGVPYEGARSVDAIALAIDGVNVAASVITLVTFRSYATRLVDAIRRFRTGRADVPMVLTVRGRNASGHEVDIRLPLPANVSTQRLLDELAPLFE